MARPVLPMHALAMHTVLREQLHDYIPVNHQRLVPSHGHGLHLPHGRA